MPAFVLIIHILSDGGYDGNKVKGMSKKTLMLAVTMCKVIRKRALVLVIVIAFVTFATSSIKIA